MVKNNINYEINYYSYARKDKREFSGVVFTRNSISYK